MIKVEHYDSIMEMFSPFFDSWMDDTDKYNFIHELISEQGKSFSTVSDEINIGVANGYSVIQQIDICKAVLATNRIKRKL